ncbi:hypothetical protein [Actimicrobium antarcticum]
MSLARAALAVLFIGASAGSHAAFRCDSNGSVTYTDTACPGGKPLPESDLRQPATMQSDLRAAQQRADADKRQLGALAASRSKTERAEQKQRNHARTIASNHRKKCDALALQSKWAREDAAAATNRSAEKTRRKSQRLEQKYALDCQV